MKQIDKKRNGLITLCTYSTDKIHDLDSACEWIIKVCDIPNLIVDYISLNDLGERNDEGNTSKRIKGKTSLDELKRQIKEVVLYIISVTGEYKDKIITIGIDVRDYTVLIAMHNDNVALIEEVQQYL